MKTYYFDSSWVASSEASLHGLQVAIVCSLPLHMAGWLCTQAPGVCAFSPQTDLGTVHSTSFNLTYVFDSVSKQSQSKQGTSIYEFGREMEESTQFSP